MIYCPRCGMQNADGAIYCARCGSSVNASPAQAGGSPTVVVVGNNQQQAPVGSNPGTVWLWLNIAATVLCCSIFSIIGLIFGAMSTSKYNNGLYNESLSNASTAKVMFIIGVILGALAWIGSIIYIIAMGGIMAIPFLAQLGG